jgi:hypothetical protein
MNDEFKGSGRILPWPNHCVIPVFSRGRLKKIKRSIDQDTRRPGNDDAQELHHS